MFRKLLILLTTLLCIVGFAACGPGLLQNPTEPSRVGDGGPSPHALKAGVTNWQQIDTAMELGRLRLHAATNASEVTIVRFDPSAYKISVMYDVANAGSVHEWFQALQPLLVVNGGYFDQQRRATGLVIFDGVKRGESYQGFGGMILTNAAGEFELRSLRQQPYDPNEPLPQAMQSAPMLIQPGGEVAELEDDQARARRTVIARDTSGRILLIVSDLPVFTLSELAQALKRSDLDLDAALNLDGGRSTGLYLHTDTASVRINSLDRVPLVLVVERDENEGRTTSTER